MILQFESPTLFVSEKKLYGRDISDRKFSTSFFDQSEIPDPKSTSVSFMKVEELPFYCKVFFSLFLGEGHPYNDLLLHRIYSLLAIRSSAIRSVKSVISYA